MASTLCLSCGLVEMFHGLYSAVILSGHKTCLESIAHNSLVYHLINCSTSKKRRKLIVLGIISLPAWGCGIDLQKWKTIFSPRVGGCVCESRERRQFCKLTSDADTHQRPGWTRHREMIATNLTSGSAEHTGGCFVCHTIHNINVLHLDPSRSI